MAAEGDAAASAHSTGIDHSVVVAASSTVASITQRPGGGQRIEQLLRFCHIVPKAHWIPLLRHHAHVTRAEYVARHVALREADATIVLTLCCSRYAKGEKREQGLRLDAETCREDIGRSCRHYVLIEYPLSTTVTVCTITGFNEHHPDCKDCERHMAMHATARHEALRLYASGVVGSKLVSAMETVMHGLKEAYEHRQSSVHAGKVPGASVDRTTGVASMSPGRGDRGKHAIKHVMSAGDIELARTAAGGAARAFEDSVLAASCVGESVAAAGDAVDVKRMMTETEWLQHLVSLRQLTVGLLPAQQAAERGCIPVRSGSFAAAYNEDDVSSMGAAASASSAASDIDCASSAATTSTDDSCSSAKSGYGDTSADFSAVALRAACGLSHNRISPYKWHFDINDASSVAREVTSTARGGATTAGHGLRLFAQMQERGWAKVSMTTEDRDGTAQVIRFWAVVQTPEVRELIARRPVLCHAASADSTHGLEEHGM